MICVKKLTLCNSDVRGSLLKHPIPCFVFGLFCNLRLKSFVEKIHLTKLLCCSRFGAWRMLLTRSQMGFAISTNELEETGGVLTNGSAAACVSPAQRVTGETQGGERTRRKGCGPGGTATF